jgi:hypothetical protein
MPLQIIHRLASLHGYSDPKQKKKEKEREQSTPERRRYEDGTEEKEISNRNVGQY